MLLKITIVSIVIIFNNKDPKPWATILQQKLPNTTIEIYPNVKDNTTIYFALCWKPDKNVLSQFPNLKVAQSVGASADNIINTQELSVNTIVTRIVDDQLNNDMYEYLLTGIMGYLKNTALYAEDKNSKTWQPKPYKTILNTTICILGLGKIGAYAAQKLSALGFTVKGWSRSAKKLENITTFYGENGLQEALDATDVLINLLPFTTETENILNETNLAQLNKNSYLINVGRGQHLVEKDLLYLLGTKHLSGALLDVFRDEPLPAQHAFWTNANITITPHIASITNVETASEVVVENYKKLQHNEALTNIISLKNGY
jgi:glyoxylate/hydroxypyruvate reductase